MAEIWFSVSLHTSIGFCGSLLGLVRHTRKGSDTLLGRWERFKLVCLYSSTWKSHGGFINLDSHLILFFE